jgi:hypothetical protein
LASLTVVFALLSTGFDFSQLVPSTLLSLMSSSSPPSPSGVEGEIASELASVVSLANDEEAISTGAKAAVLGRLGASLGIVEVVGPLRLALTVAVTPPLSGTARRFEVVRNAEAGVAEWVAKAQETFSREPAAPSQAKEK